MEWLALAAGAVALAAVVVLIVRRFGRREVDASSGDPSARPDQRRRPDTALSELRDMREALGPAAHNRVERRRNPQPGSAPKIERRKKGARREP